MAKQLSILFVTSEVFPFAKHSTMADISYSLPLAIKEIGEDIRVMMPKYGHVSERKNRIHDINRLRDMPVPINDSDVFATIKSSSIQNSRSKVQTYVTTNDEYFNQLKGIYYSFRTGEIFTNNAERFIFFARSVVETCVLLEWFPDIIHCNNWQTALVPAFAKLLYPNKFKKTQFVFTAHDMFEQGEFPWSEFKRTGLPDEDGKEFKHKNKLNFLKPALVYSDYLTFGNESYYKDLLSDAKLSNGLNTILKSRKDVTSVIQTHMDKWSWNPAKDDYLELKMEEKDHEKFKYDNKVNVINKFEFEYHPRKPLFVMTHELQEKNGYKTLIDSIKEILKNDILLVVHGDGDEELKSKLTELAEKNKDKFGFEIGNNEYTFRSLYAGADFHLNISDYETSGILMMNASRYGAVPIVAETGAIKNLAIDASEENGNSLVFQTPNKANFVKAISRALDFYKDKEAFEGLSERIAEIDNTWHNNAAEYVEIYRDLRA